MLWSQLMNIKMRRKMSIVSVPRHVHFHRAIPCEPLLQLLTDTRTVSCPLWGINEGKINIFKNGRDKSKFILLIFKHCTIQSVQFSAWYVPKGAGQCVTIARHISPPFHCPFSFDGHEHWGTYTWTEYELQIIYNFIIWPFIKYSCYIPHFHTHTIFIRANFYI